jgi:hypothetical protein
MYCEIKGLLLAMDFFLSDLICIMIFTLKNKRHFASSYLGTMYIYYSSVQSTLE